MNCTPTTFLPYTTTTQGIDCLNTEGLVEPVNRIPDPKALGKKGVLPVISFFNFCPFIQHFEWKSMNCLYLFKAVIALPKYLLTS